MKNETVMDYEAFYEKTKRVSLTSTILFVNVGIILIILGILLMKSSIWFLIVFGLIGVFLFVTFVMYGLKGYPKELKNKASQFGLTSILYTFEEDKIKLEIKIDNKLNGEQTYIKYDDIKKVIDSTKWIIIKCSNKIEFIINKTTMISGTANDLSLYLKEKTK